MPAALAAPSFSVASIDPVVFYTSPGSTCTTQPPNSVTLPTAAGTGTISYAIASLPTGVTLTGNTLTGDPATISAQNSMSYTYIATDAGDNQTASLTFTLEVVDEKAILEAFYTATDGDNWTNKTGGWGDPITATCLNDLMGVEGGALHTLNEVDVRGRVSTLHLADNNLTGTIPRELGKLTRLRYLHLNDNQLSGSIPTELGSLTSLTILYLNDNQLSGPIPDLSALTSLGTLVLNDNQLSGSIPDLSALTSLGVLHLNDNQLTGAIPTLPTGLVDLRLQNNKLTGTIPDLSALTSLQLLYLYDNQLTGAIPTLPTGLGDLRFNNNQLSGSIPAELGSLTSLTTLQLHNNQLSGSIPAELGSLTSLTTLQLHNNQLSGSIPSELGSLTRLAALTLYNNQLSGTLEVLNGLNPTHLYLHNNRLTGPIPEFPNATGHFRLSLYGNAGLYGYPAALDNRSLLRLLAPGDGSAVCLPTTQGGTDCTVPTLVDNLRVQPSAPQLVFSWAPNSADPVSGYAAWYFPSPSGPWTPATVTGTTATTPDSILAFLVRTTDAPNSPRLYWLPGSSPPRSGPLTVDATPPCGSTVTDTSVRPRYALVLDLPPATDTQTESRWVADSATGVWGLTVSSTTRNPFAHLRDVFPGFRGFEFRLANDRDVTAQCFWTFDPRDDDRTSDPVPPQPPPSPPTVSGPPTGGGPSPGGSGSPPAVPSDPAPDSPRCGETDREYLERFYEMTNGEGWDRDDYWRNSEELLEEWFGVGTDEDERVISLLLPDNGLSGEMPEEELLCLTELKELALWDNDGLSGKIPDELALPVERAALRDIAERLNINPKWFEDCEEPCDFEEWYAGVTTDDDGRVIELDLPGKVSETLISQFRKLRMITTSSEGGGCALSPKDDSSTFSLFLLALLVFAVLVRKRVRG